MKRGRARDAALRSALLATLAACSMTVSKEGVEGLPGQGWKRAVDIRIGEMAIVDGSDLELSLAAVDVDRATIVAATPGNTLRQTLVVGLDDEMTVPPYTIRLLSTDISGEAAVEIRKGRR